jgi:hypothetical protein
LLNNHIDIEAFPSFKPQKGCSKQEIFTLILLLIIGTILNPPTQAQSVRDLLNSFFVPSKVKNLNLLWEREREREQKNGERKLKK